MSHEHSVTFKTKKGWGNFISVVNGQQLTSDQVRDLYEKNLLAPIEGKYYSNVSAAITAAKKKIP